MINILSKKEKVSNQKPTDMGFTLIEIMVASSLFLSVMLIVSGAVLSVFDSNQKSKNLRSVMDNFNLTMENMTRTIRFGTNYHCGLPVGASSSLDCGTPSTTLTVTDSNGVQVTYSTTTTATKISRQLNSGAVSYITSPDVTITNLKFWVLGSDTYCVSSCASKNTSQPRVIILVSGYVGIKPTTRSSFTLQTTVSQRVFDFIQ